MFYNVKGKVSIRNSQGSAAMRLTKSSEVKFYEFFGLVLG